MTHGPGGSPAHPPSPTQDPATAAALPLLRPLWQRQLPNALTNLRLVLAAAFFVVLSRWHIDGSSALDANKTSTDNALLLAALLFVLAAVTDALDGFFARLWKVQSVFGRVMDPFADKILVLGGFVLLAGSAFTSRQFPNESFSCVEPWMVIVILARELLVTSLRGMVESRGHSFAATASGKWKMILQSVCIPFVLVMIATRDVRPDVGTDTPGDGWDMAVPGGRMLVMISVYLTVTVTAWSAFPYLMRAIRVLRQPPPAAPQPLQPKEAPPP